MRQSCLPTWFEPAAGYRSTPPPFELEKTSPRMLNSFLTLSNACSMILIRGGVEDTRLEAKAKDTKKSRGQGQGQPFRRRTLSRPRTGMLEAKAKDQGHSRKCSPKHKNKKRSSKKFFRRSPIHRRTRNFWLGEAETTNHLQWRHQKFSNEEGFVGQRYRRMEDLKSLAAGGYPGFC